MKFLFTLFAVLFLSLTATPTFAQKKPNFIKRYLNKFVNDSTEKSEPQFLIYPTVAYAPETSWEFGFSSVFVGYAKGDTNNRLSEINAFVFATTKKQYGAFVEHALHSNKNTWFFLGKLKTQSFPLSYYGIGFDSPKQKLAEVDAFSFNWKERVLRKVYKDFFIGLEFDLQHLGNVRFEDYQTDVTYTKPFGYQGSTNVGVGFGLLYDNRHNVLNVRHGVFAEIATLSYREKLGSISNFSTVFSDFRYFIPIRKRNVLALQSLGQFTNGNAPFNQYALMGGEMMMRGYYMGRYRDKNMLTLQAEYRMLPLSFAKKFGFAVFGSTGVIYDQAKAIGSDHFKYAGGAGIHYLVFPRKDVWTRIDFAVNNEGGTGFYFFMGCAF